MANPYLPQWEYIPDGDVTGPFDQIATVKEFCEYIKADSENWLSGFTFYQFRDDGRFRRYRN